MKNLNIINNKLILDILKRKFYITICKIINAWLKTVDDKVKKEKALVLDYFTKENARKKQQQSYNDETKYNKILTDARNKVKELLIKEFPNNNEALKTALE